LMDIIVEAVDKRASEVEIIPGKGSGALKKSVLRFLERPEIKCLYHRIEKDDENFGRLFVHFRFSPALDKKAGAAPKPKVVGQCFCCAADVVLVLEDDLLPSERIQRIVECGACGSPNRLIIASGSGGRLSVVTGSGYEEAS
jgi:hypothetical protein